MQITKQYRSLGFSQLPERNLAPMSIFSTCAVIIPSLNAAEDWPRLIPSLLASISTEQVMVIDSSSDDGTADLARAAGFRVHSISRAGFNHGGTRQLAADLLPQAELLVFLTQDAILADHEAFKALLAPFSDPQ